MIVVKNIDDKELEKINFLILNIIKGRKLEFNGVEIYFRVKMELIDMGYNEAFAGGTYVDLTIHHALKKLIDEGWLYEIGDMYFPVNYAIYKDFCVNGSNLFYLKKEEDKSKFINVITMVEKKRLGKKDFLLTGGYSNLENALEEATIPLDEVHRLYVELVGEGAKKEDAINHILNYYKSDMIMAEEGCPMIMMIQRKKEFLYKKENVIELRRISNKVIEMKKYKKRQLQN